MRSRAILIIGGAFVLWMGVLLAVMAVFMGWVFAHTDEVMAEVAQASQEGREFGESTVDVTCLDELFRRDAACIGLACDVKNGAFVESCVASAPPALRACPESPIEGIWAQSKWSVEVCTRHGALDRKCPQLNGFLNACDETRAASRVP